MSENKEIKEISRVIYTWMDKIHIHSKTNLKVYFQNIIVKQIYEQKSLVNMSEIYSNVDEKASNRN